MKTVVRIIQKDNGVYQASCPALPGCTAEATTRREALQEIEDRVYGYLASLDVAFDEKQPPQLAVV